MAVHLQVYAESAGEGGLAAGGRTGDQNDVFVLLVDLPGDIVDGGFMQRFIDTDEIPQLFLLNHPGKVRDVGDAQNLAPFRTLAENLQVLRTVDIGRRVFKVRTGRELQYETTAELKHGEDFYVTGGDGHGAVEVLPHAVNAVHIEIGGRTMLQQGNLVLLLLLFEVADGVILRPPFLFKNEVQVSQSAHLIFNPDNILAVQIHAGEADKHAVADGILDPYPLIGIKVAERQQHHKTQGALIDPAPFLIFQGQGDQRTVLAELVIQLADHAAGLGGKGSHGERVQRFQARSDCGAFREFFFFVHGTDNHIVTLLSTICRVCLHYDLYHPYYR